MAILALFESIDAQDIGQERRVSTHISSDTLGGGILRQKRCLENRRRDYNCRQR